MENYFSLGTNTFQLAELYDTKGKEIENFNLDLMLIAGTKFGGPYVITTDENALIPKDTDKYNLPLNYVCIFKNNGTLLNKYNKSEITNINGSKSSIVALDFLKNETLLVVLRDGTFILYEPIQKRPLRVISIRGNYVKDAIVEGAKAVDNGVIFCTNSNGNLQFHFIKDLLDDYDIQPEKFIHDPLNENMYLKNFKLCFIPVSETYSPSKKIECLLNDSQAGVIRLIQGEKDKVDFGITPSKYSSGNSYTSVIAGIRLIALSTKRIDDKQGDCPKVALLTLSGKIYVYNYHFPLNKVTEINYDPNLEGLPERDLLTKDWKLYWAGLNLLVLTIGGIYWMIPFDTKMKKKDTKTKGIFCVQELDGLKIITNKKVDLLRELSEDYKGVFLLESTKSSKDLYDAYRENEERRPSPVNKILQNKSDLEQSAITGCIQAATFELDPDVQKQLLKAAAFGKSFLNTNSSFNHDVLPDVCKKLRVLHAIRSHEIARTMTYEQFQTLSQKEIDFVNILLKYNYFCMANEVAKYLDFSPDIVSHIYIQWACSKIDNDDPDDKISFQISEKLKHDKTISFVEIAHRAFEKNKPQLAKKLMDYESSVYKKVPVLIWLGDYQKGLEEACKSLDPNLIDLVILQVLKDPTVESQVLPILVNLQRSKPRVFKYILNFYYDNHYQPLKMNIPSAQADNKKAVPSGIGDFLFASKPYEFFMKYGTDDEKIFFTLWRCFCERREVAERGIRKYVDLDFKDKIELLKNLRIQIKSKDILKMYEETLSLYETNLQTLKNAGQSEDRPIMTRYLEEIKLNSPGITEMPKKFKINDKMAFIAKIRVYCDDPNPDNLEKLDQLLKNKYKSDYISYFELATMLYEKGLVEKAEFYIAKIPEKEFDDQMLFFKTIGSANSIKNAIEIAIKYKKADRVKEFENLYYKLKNNGTKVDEEVFGKIAKFKGIKQILIDL